MVWVGNNIELYVAACGGPVWPGYTGGAIKIKDCQSTKVHNQ